MSNAASSRAALDGVRERITSACERAGRPPSDVVLIAVTKTVPLERVREMMALGQTVFGENRVQEAKPKVEGTGPAARWHLVGHLQRNKARHAVGLFEMIHSLDDLDLVRELDRRAAAAGLIQPVLIEVNLGAESSKQGVDEEGLAPLAEAAAGSPNLDLQGLMVIPPPAADPERSRHWFVRLRALRDALVPRLGRSLPHLSMGMSDDYGVAIEEGATLVRVGRALFGERPAPARSVT